MKFNRSKTLAVIIATVAIAAFILDGMGMFCYVYWNSYSINSDGSLEVRLRGGGGGDIGYQWTLEPKDWESVPSNGERRGMIWLKPIRALRSRRYLLTFNWPQIDSSSVNVHLGGFEFTARHGMTLPQANLSIFPEWSIDVPLYPFWVIPLIVLAIRWHRRKKTLARGFEFS